MPISKMTFDDVEALLNKSLQQFVLRPIATTVPDAAKKAEIQRHINIGIQVNTLLSLWHRDPQHQDDSISLNIKGVLAVLEEFIKSEKEKHYTGKDVQSLENLLVIQELEDYESSAQKKYEKLEKSLVLSGVESKTTSSDKVDRPSIERRSRLDPQDFIPKERRRLEGLYEQQAILASMQDSKTVLTDTDSPPKITKITSNINKDDKYEQYEAKINSAPNTVTQSDNPARDAEEVTSDTEEDTDSQQLELARAISLSLTPNNDVSGSQQDSALNLSSVGSTSTNLPPQYAEGAAVVGFFTGSASTLIH